MLLNPLNSQVQLNQTDSISGRVGANVSDDHPGGLQISVAITNARFYRHVYTDLAYRSSALHGETECDQAIIVSTRA